MKFLDADVKKPLGSVSAIVDEGNIAVFGQQDCFFREHEHKPEYSNEQEERRVCDAVGRWVRERRKMRGSMNRTRTGETLCFHVVSVNKSKIDNEARKKVCATRIEGVKMLQEEEEVNNQENRKDLNAR